MAPRHHPVDTALWDTLPGKGALGIQVPHSEAPGGLWFLGGDRRPLCPGPCTHGLHTCTCSYVCISSRVEQRADQRSQAGGQGCQPQWCWEMLLVGTCQAEPGGGQAQALPRVRVWLDSSVPLTA